ncbi:MAG: hypothetical protein Q7R81_03050 [Candidatus Peregrinibacteria bacterium]|nr:hypothetical protein [Candidatus Peregrinibacteria bacterium]
MKSRDYIPSFEQLEERTLMDAAPTPSALLAGQMRTLMETSMQVSYEQAAGAQQRESASVTPSFFLSAEGNEIVLYYTNMPTGVRWEVVQAGETRPGYNMMQSTLSSGTGTARMKLVSDINREAESVFVRLSTNAQVGPRVSFRINSGQMVRPPTADVRQVPELTYIPGQGITAPSTASLNALMADAYAIDDALQVANTTLSPAVQQATDICRQYKFYNKDGRYYENDVVSGSKWFQSGLDDQWFLMMPDGKIYRFAGRSLGESTLVGQVDSAYHKDLPKFFSLASASSTTTAAPAATEVPAYEKQALAVQQQYKFYNKDGRYYENDVVSGSKWFQSGLDDQWFLMMPDGKIYKFAGRSLGESTLVGQVDSAYHKDLPKFFALSGTVTTPTVQAPVEAAPLSALEQAKAVQTKYKFYNKDNRWYENDIEKGTKWFQSGLDDQWFVMMPTGKIYRFAGRSLGESTVVATVDPGYYPDITRLFNGLAPLAVSSTTSSTTTVTAEPAPRTYTYAPLSTQSLMSTFHGQLMEDLKLSSFPLTPRDYAARAYPQFFGASPDLDAQHIHNMAVTTAREDTYKIHGLEGWYTRQRDDMVKGAAEAMRYGYEMISNAAEAAFAEIYLVRTGKPIAYPKRVEEMLSNHPHAREVGDYLRGAMPTAADLRALVNANFDKLYDRHMALINAEKGMNKQIQDVSNALAPSTLTEAEKVARLQELNRNQISLAWQQMLASGQTPPTSGTGETVATAPAEDPLDQLMKSLTEAGKAQLFNRFSQELNALVSMQVVGTETVAGLEGAAGNFCSLVKDSFAKAFKSLDGKAFLTGAVALDAAIPGPSVQFSAKFLNALLKSSVAEYFVTVGKMRDLAVKNAVLRNGANLNSQEDLLKYHTIGFSKSVQEITPEFLQSSELRSKVFLHVKPNNTATVGKIVFVFLGNSQTLGDVNAGVFQQAVLQAKSTGVETLIFRVGNLTNELKSNLGLDATFSLHPEVIFSHTKNIVQDRLARRGVFSAMSQAQEVNCVAYSWGVGTADRLFGNENDKKALLGSAVLNSAAYIDGVLLGMDGRAQSVSRRPAANHFFNVYQQHTATVEYDFDQAKEIAYFDILQGEPARGDFIAGAENAQQSMGLQYTHNSIDEEMGDDAFRFIMASIKP